LFGFDKTKVGTRPTGDIGAKFTNGSMPTLSGQSILSDHLELSAKKLPFD